MPHPHPVLARVGRRIAAAGAVLLVLVVGLSTGVVPGLGSGVPLADAATVCGGSVGEGQIRVVIVVDPGPSGPGGPGATCLVVARGTTGAQLLAERAAALGVFRPRYADSGLLCAFDGYPATGCGERTANGYAYWASFSGTSGSWVYGAGNPFIRRLADGDVEGWRFVDGTGTGQDPPPRLSPSGLFPPLAPPPSATVPPVPAPAPTPGGGGGGAPIGPSVDAGVVPGAPPTGPAGAAVTGSAGSASAGAGLGERGDPTASVAEVEAGGDGAGPVTGRGVDADQQSDDDELAADVAVSSSSPAGPVGAVIAGLVIAVLVTAAVWRSRAHG